MATITTTQLYLGTYNAATNTFTPGTTLGTMTITATDGTADTTFTVGETITLTGMILV